MKMNENVLKKGKYKLNLLLGITCIVMLAFASSCSNDDDEPKKTEPYDLGITLVQHESGKIVTHGNLYFEFEITNHGTSTIPAGTKVYASSKIDGVLFSFDLLSSNPTEITLDAALAPGGKATVNPGYLEGKTTLAFLGKPSADFCIILWGVGEESVNDISKYDTNSANNEVCITFATYDLAVALDGYTAGQVFSEGNVPLTIKVTNHSDVTFPAGTELKMSARIGGTLFSLDLASANPTTIPLTAALAPGASATFPAGFLSVELTLAMLATSSTDICILLWGIGDTSVGETFPDDLNGSNNETCITFSVE